MKATLQKPLVNEDGKEFSQIFSALVAEDIQNSITRSETKKRNLTLYKNGRG